MYVCSNFADYRIDILSFQVAGAIVTYELVLIQFNSSAEQSASASS